MVVILCVEDLYVVEMPANSALVVVAFVVIALMAMMLQPFFASAEKWLLEGLH